MSENIFDKAKSVAGSLKNKVTNLSDIFQDKDKEDIISVFKEKGEDKIDEVFSILDQYKSLFFDAGYEIGGINVSLGLPPDISVSFKFLGSVDENKRNEIESKTTDSKLASIILSSLFKASDFAEKIKVGDLKLKSINIKLGLIPSISVSLA
jgi:hypothetical protein